MKERLLHNWTITRVFYVLIGSYTAISAFIEKEWIFGILGLLFASMGLFALGCAGKNCFSKSCEISNQKSNPSIEKEIEYEEIK